jgi:GNAT superfamily N-acetyltransferase
MVIMQQDKYSLIHDLYLKSGSFFPLIAAVLQQEQDGVVYVNEAQRPTQAYVEHAFGFAQIFGESDEQFEHQVQHYLLNAADFKPDKIRLYVPKQLKFLSLPESLRAYRQRFVWSNKKANSLEPLTCDIQIVTMNAANAAHIESRFNIATRFWRSMDDFMAHSRAVVVYQNNEPASLCYAAAKADRSVEIDVLTLPEYRQQGLAKFAVMHFVTHCEAASLMPLWDCFTNNLASMALCHTTGFTPLHEPYPFYTMPKQKGAL